MNNYKYLHRVASLLIVYTLTFSPSATSNEISPVFIDLYQSYGFDNESTKTVRDLSKNHVVQTIPDVIKLQLAKRLFQRGNLDKTSSILSSIGRDLPAHMQEEKILLNADVLIASRKYQQAYDISHPRGTTPEWAYFAQYNLATALIKDKQTEKGIQMLDQLGTLENDTSELIALKDHTNLTLGNYYLGINDGNKANECFERVRPNHQYYSQALLGKGWAFTELYQYPTAIIPWNQLQQHDPHSHEAMASLMAVPYVLGKMDAFQQAIDNYRSAINIFTQEIYDLGIVSESLQKGTWIDNMLQTTSNLSIAETREKIQSTLNQDIQLRPVALNEEFQTNMDEYIKLILLQQLLNNTSNNLSGYDRKKGTAETTSKKYGEILNTIKKANNRLKLLSEDEVHAMTLVNLAEKESLRTLKFFNVSGANETTNINSGIILWDIISNNYIENNETNTDFNTRINQALAFLDKTKKTKLSELNKLAIAIIKKQQEYIEELKSKAFLFIAQLSDIEYAMTQDARP